MNWVFCNKCSFKFHPNVKFFLSECGHIFCERCVDKIRQVNKCAVCNRSTSTMELSKDMDHNMQMFFWPLENMLEQSLKVFNFQSMQKSLFMQSLTRKYNYAKKECINYYNANKKLQKENQMMRDMLKSVGYNPPPFITSTPAKSSDRTYDHNLSMLSSIRLTPGSIPGSVHRVQYDGRGLFQQPIVPGSISSSTNDPSPAQMVPKGYLAPVHRQATMQNPAAATPRYMDKYGVKSGYPSMGYPKK